MKITKLLSAAAAAVVAVSAVAATASADFRAISGGSANLLADGTGNYGICLLSDGTNKDGVPACSVEGLDLSAIAHVSFTFRVIDDADNRTWWDGQGGGAIVVSTHSPEILADAELYNKYNWVQNGNFWGVVDEALELNTLAVDQDIQAVKVDDYTYKIEADITNPYAAGDAGNINYFRIFMQVWSFTMADIEVTETVMSDAAGNVLATFDAMGNPTVAGGTSTPVADTTVPTEGGNKGGVPAPDTGVEGVAAVAGLAVVAGGAVVLSRKRK